MRLVPCARIAHLGLSPQQSTVPFAANLIALRVPTVLRIGGRRVVIYPADHTPAHVHVIGDGCEALFLIADPVVLRENYGFPVRTLTRITAELEAQRDVLLEAWRRIHGA